MLIITRKMYSFHRKLFKLDVELRCLFLILIIIILVQFYIQYKQPYIKSLPKVKKINLNSKINEQNERLFDPEYVELFKEIALNSDTDKVTTHHYEHIYGFLFGPLRHKKINLLEIGLGCDMPYGPGKSIGLWQMFFTDSNVSILEFNKTCSQIFVNKVKHIFSGDQRDLSFLKNVGEIGGPFDIIIDDGGHTRKQQINSLIGLWPYVSKHGGIYVIEDFFTSFIKEYNDHQKSLLDLLLELIVLLNDPEEVGFTSQKNTFPRISISEEAVEIRRDLMSINCFERACALIKI
jgi:hypothetical protein